MKLIFMLKAAFLAISLFIGCTIAGWVIGGILLVIAVEYIESETIGRMLLLAIVGIVLMAYFGILYALLKENTKEISNIFFGVVYVSFGLIPPFLFLSLCYWIIENMHLGF